MDISIGSPEGSDVVGFIYNPADPTADQLFIDANILYDFIQIPMTEIMQLDHIESDERMLSFTTYNGPNVTNGEPSGCQSCRKSDLECRISLTESPIQKSADLTTLILCLPCVRKLQYELYLKSEELRGELTADLL